MVMYTDANKRAVYEKKFEFWPRGVVFTLTLIKFGAWRFNLMVSTQEERHLPSGQFVLDSYEKLVCSDRPEGERSGVHKQDPFS